MAKARRVFVCRSCGASQARWMGKCPDCGTWDALEETTLDPMAAKDPQKALVGAWAQLQDQDGPDATSTGAGQTPARSLHEVLEGEGAASPVARLPTGIHEFDRALGASLDRSGLTLASGLVPGSAVLVGGEPGIGKSTLLMQAAIAWAASGTRVLYVSSEESAQQVAMRAGRVGGVEGATQRGSEGAKKQKDARGPARDSDLFLLHDTNLARIIEQTRKTQPRVLVIDSIQMIYRADVSAAPGSVTQLRRCCAELVYLAKQAGIAVVMVGHVTKDGTLAGPRLLEHLVDTVLSFEGDRGHSHRVVRALKNRFGNTMEIGLFEMGPAGLRPVEDGGVVGAIRRGQQPPAGCVLCPVLTGTRTLLVEVQALTATGFLGAAKRTCSGLDSKRMAMLIAVLEQHAGLRLSDRDIFASSVGGLKVVDPASDLALLLAIASAHHRKPMPARACVFGEVGLSGEVRPVPQLEQRVREAARLGCTRIVVPLSREVAGLPRLEGVEVRGVRNVDQAIEEIG